MKKIYVTESQLVKTLKETINQTIDKKPGEDLDNAIRTAAREVQQDAPNADVNFVIPKDEVNEGDELETKPTEAFHFTKKDLKKALKRKKIEEAKIVTTKGEIIKNIKNK